MCALLALAPILKLDAAGSDAPAAYAKAVFLSAQENRQAHPQDWQTGWQFARACFDWAEFATNHAQRAELANLGIAAAQAAIRGRSNSAAAHYYLGMNLGQLARTKTLGALRLVDDMEEEFKQARALDASFDFAGPDRNLGRLYFEAPSIGSVGSRSKARFHFNQAAKLAPDYPENRLNLIESATGWKAFDDARRELQALDDKLAEAKARFSGREWAGAWLDWNRRLERVRSALRKPVNKPARAGKGGDLFN